MRRGSRGRSVIQSFQALTATMRLLAILVVLAIPFEAVAMEPAAPPSVSCLGADGESYLRGLLDRIHQLERQLDAEIAAAKEQLKKVEGFDPEGAKKQLAALKAALDEATAARRNAEEEAAAAGKAAAKFAHALEEAESRLAAAEKRNASAIVARPLEAKAADTKDAVAAPVLESSANAAPIERAPTPRPATPSERDLAEAQLAALTGKRPSTPANEAPSPAAAPKAADVATPEPPPSARFAPGDRLAICVEHLDEVSGTVEVGSDGEIELPLLGRVPASGRNQGELVAELTERLTAYLQQPRVDVTLERGAEEGTSPCGTRGRSGN